MLLYALDSAQPLFEEVARCLQQSIAQHEERVFEDGECKLRPLTDPGGHDVYVMQSLHGEPGLSAHDRLWRLWTFAATLRDHGAARVTAVIPYLAYARKDRRTKPFDPLSLRHLAQLFEAAGVQRLIALEVHDAAAFENAFRCPIVHVRASCVFDALFNDLSGSVGSLAVEQPQVAPVQTDFAMAPGAACWVVASPDPGGVKRAQLWRESLQTRLGHELGFAMLDKRRSAGVVSTDDLVAGDVKGAQVLLYDDLISSGGTMRRAAQALRTHGADRVVAVAAHGLFAQHAQDLLAEPALDAVVVSDSVPSMRHCAAAQGAGRLRVMSAARPLARAIDSLSR
jgi:ribose-phosphate pyrophosphokinase